MHRIGLFSRVIFPGKHTRLAMTVCGVLMMCAGSRAAKQRSSAMAARPLLSRAHASAQAYRPERLQARLQPYFSHKAGIRHKEEPEQRPTAPTQKDLFAIAAHWDRLSPAFKDVYLRAAASAVPNDSQSFRSPGGHFVIIYTVTNTDSTRHAVDSTDAYGYDRNDWRVRSSGANGVPDYIDELAWALDSTWAMEIDRFGFDTPASSFAHIRARDRYAVVVRNLARGYYAFSYPGERVDGDSTGFSSYMEVRNSWNDPVFAPLGYTSAYENALRVTAAHEFFHAIQFAMVHTQQNNMFLDDFPVAWIEGTAVMMEDVAFDDINDFVQYSTSYFDTPQRPLLQDRYMYYGDYIYAHSLLTLFLYRVTGSIDIIARTFFANRTTRIPFAENLAAAAAHHGYAWHELLARFHAESWFSGSRADTGYFLTEAAALDQWDPAPASAGSTSFMVKPFAMKTLSFSPQTTHPDTLSIYYGRHAGTPAAPAVDSLVRFYCIGERDGADTLISLPPVSAAGTDSIRLCRWHSYDRVIVTATNGSGIDSASLYTAFLHHGTAVADAPLALYPNPLRSDQSLFLRARDLTDRLRFTTLYTLSGRCITTTRLQPEGLPSGTGWRWHTPTTLEWNAHTRETALHPGTYIAVIGLDNETLTKKIMVRP
jgi:hypothetical protein